MSSGNSYNGWPANSDPSAIGVVQSQWFPGGAKAGDVTTVLGYVARQLDARVEPIVGGWCWGYTYKQNVNNPSSLSCHASGTAIDWNAPDHPNGSSGTFTDAQVGTIYAILDECQGAVDWLEGYDEMHFEIAVNATDLATVAASLGTGPGPNPNPPIPEDDDMPLLVHFMFDNAHCLWAPAAMTWSKVHHERWDTVRWAYTTAGASVVDWDGPGLDADPGNFGSQLPLPAFGISP